MNPKRVILIIAPPGNLQIGLQAVLTTHLDVDVLVTSKVSAAMKVIKIHRPPVVVLDDDVLNDSVPMIIQDVRNGYPDTACIVMVNDEDSGIKFLDLGADTVIIKGYPPQKLIAIIEDFLNRRDPTSSLQSDSDGGENETKK